MEPSPLVPLDFQENRLHHYPQSRQHQGIICYNPEVPSQVQPAAHPFINQQAIMPSQGSPEVEAMRMRLPLSQGSFVEASWHPLQQNVITGSEQAQSLSRAEVSQHPLPEQGLLQPSQHTTFSGFRLESTPSHEQPTARGSNEQCYSEDNTVRLPTEFTSHQPFETESHMPHDRQGLIYVAQNHGSPGQTGRNGSGVVMAGRTESECLGMGRPIEELHQVRVGAWHSEHLEATARPCPAMSQHVAPSNHQGLSFRPGATSHDVNFIRKLRQRERSYGGKWKSKEQIHGKRNQQDMEEDSCNLPPSKQFISEEKMAARMSNLSITSNNKMAILQERWLQAKKQAKRQLEEIESRLSDSESDVESESDFKEVRGVTSDQHRQIQVSPELKTALRQQQGLLPNSIVKSMPSACNQLVLWKPPSSFIGDVINASSNQGQVSQDKSNLQSSDGVIPAVPCTREMGAKHTQDMSSGIARPVDWNSIPYGLTASATELFDSMDDDMDL